MKRYLALFFLLWIGAACGGTNPPPTDPGPDDDPGCVDCPPTCQEPEAPAGCPEALVEPSVDLQTGCPTLICGPCPFVEEPACEDGLLEAERDEATACIAAWTCRPCLEAPACEEGTHPVEEEVEGSCVLAWSCAACSEVEPATCEEATPTFDPATGCLAGWNCPACPEPEVPHCTTGDPILETDPETGCSEWICPPCPEPVEITCEEGFPSLGEDPVTGCAAWICPICPEVEDPSCTSPEAVLDEETGCTVGWICPDDPWSDLEHLSGTQLRQALRARVDGHVSWTYDDIRDEMFGWVDVQADGKIECVYTGRRVDPVPGSRTPGGFNTEHSWPRSDGAKGRPPETDLHHLFPTDMEANSQRGNLAFGDTDCVGGCSWAEGGSEKGRSVTGSATVFEVRPSHRGDIARAHFYFAVRYGMDIPAAEETVLRRWSDEDPPSDRERERNDRIETLQLNRNPFVDRPDFIPRIADF